ncbi:MAG: SGNH/GDSL hydrolase family protein [Polyangiales bacterium]
MRLHLFLGCALLLGCGSADDGGAAPASDAVTSEGGDDSMVSGDSPSLDDAMTDSGSMPTDTSMPADAGPPAVRLVGRFTDKNEFAWTGSHAIARFDGTGARVKLNAGTNEQFQIVVDGKPTDVLKPTGGSKVYPVATGLSAGVHEVIVWRRTEAFFGVTTYEGFEFDGTLLPPAPAPAHRIEIVGDSITCGYGDEGAGPSCPFTADTENHYLTYGAVAARNLDADLVATCWSGIGMYRDYGTSTTDQMPVRYLRTLPESATSTWDFSKYVPHAVVINLGTNDFAKGDPGMPYQTAYLSFVRNVRKNYPSAYILAIIPVSGAKKYIDAVVSTLSGEGDKNVGSLSFSPIAPADGWGCDYHPTVASHAKMGAELTTALKSKLGW